MPLEGKEKPPNTPDNPRVGARLLSAGRAAGVEFTGKCDRAPNTVNAHCLLRLCEEKLGSKAQHNLQEALFKSYFHDGDYPNVETLTALAVGVGLDADEVRDFLNSGIAEDAIRQEAASYSRRGVNGVPFFLMNGKPMFSGAQSEATFLSAFDEAPPAGGE